MIRVNSYSDVNGLAFGASEAETIAIFGEPVGRSRNREQENVLQFPAFILRYDAVSNVLREVTLPPYCEALLNGSAVSWESNFLHRLASEDQDLVEVLGFVLSMKLGVAISGFHDGHTSEQAIHLFRRGDWDIFQKYMQPYKQPDV